MKEGRKMGKRMKNPTTPPIPVAACLRSFPEPPSQPRPESNLLTGNVKILKRGDPLTAFLPPRSDLSPNNNLEAPSTTRSALRDLWLGSTNRLGPDPETVKKEVPVTIPGKVFATGAYVTSPHPSLVPVPGFLRGAEIASHGLRRLLGVGLA